MTKTPLLKSGGPLLKAALLLFVFTLGIVTALLTSRYTGLFTCTATEARVPEAPSIAVIPPAQEPVAAGAEIKVAIVIDDLGQKIGPVLKLLEMESPVALAVLPHLRYSAEVARLGRLLGREVLLHLPMEPKDSVTHDPGTGALVTSMTAEDISAELNSNLDSLPYVLGVNNHMGSRFTEDEQKMRVVASVLKERGLFFLDSFTSPKSVAEAVARSSGVRAARRSVFLDNERETEQIRARVKELIRVAKKNGSAIAIGHPYPETIEVLSETLPGFPAEGVTVVPLSELLK